MRRGGGGEEEGMREGEGQGEVGHVHVGFDGYRPADHLKLTLISGPGG